MVLLVSSHVVAIPIRCGVVRPRGDEAKVVELALTLLTIAAGRSLCRAGANKEMESGAANGHIKVVRYLCTHRGDKLSDGKTLMSIAASNKHVGVGRYLHNAVSGDWHLASLASVAFRSASRAWHISRWGRRPSTAAKSLLAGR